MSYSTQARTRAWAVSAIMIGLWGIYGSFYSWDVFYILANAVLWIPAILIAVGGIAVILQKPWGRKVLKFAAAASAIIILVSFVGMLAIRLIPAAMKSIANMETGWPLEVRRQYAAEKLFAFWRNLIFNVAKLTYYVQIFRYMAATPVEPVGDGVGSEAKASPPDTIDARRLPWAVSALLIGCMYIHRLTASSYSTIFSSEHGRRITSPGGITWKLLDQYDLLRYVLHMPSHVFSGSLQISLILFTVIYLADAILGTALIVGSIGVIKQRAWGRTTLIVMCVAGIIVDALWLIVPQSLAHNSELVNAYAQIPSQLQRILWGYTSGYHLKTILWYGLEIVYFGLLFRQMWADPEKRPIEINTCTVA